MAGKREVSKRKAVRAKCPVALVGAGRLAAFLAPSLRDAGYQITEIIAREGAGAESMRRASALARKVGARAVRAENASLDAALLWFCVPDRAIASAADALVPRLCVSPIRPEGASVRFAFHSSGALLSGELQALRDGGIAVASVHPLMTFVEAVRPSLAGVPFALEGDASATRLARGIVRNLGSQGFTLAAERKPAYHAWATMTSPLLVAYLVTLEKAAQAAGLSREQARRMSLPIVTQTLSNYARRGAAKSFSGPIIRGDVDTVAKHLALLKADPKTQAVYVDLARVAVERLPAANREALKELLKN
jgi:predicted short-subunit dehydrogenase-like oxidoreductase (DUF2520 family)